jgi:hypothetical protein
LILLHGMMRHQNDIGAAPGNIADASEPAGQQPVLRIRKFGFQLKRAVARVNRLVRARDFACVRIDGVVGQDQFQPGNFFRRPTRLL